MLPFRAGARLRLRGLERSHAATRRAAAALGADLGCAISAEAFVTPSRAGRLPMQTDSSLLLLQLRGSQRWQLGDAHGAAPVGESREDIFVGAGDVLYLPGGAVHAAEALDEQSLHVALYLDSAQVSWIAIV